MSDPKRAAHPRLFFATAACGALVAWLAIVSHRASAPKGRDAPASDFSAARADEIYTRLFAETAPHPVGTGAAVRMRERIQAELTRIGYAPTTQEAFVCSRDGTCADVSNVMARLEGTRSGKTVLLAAHYDSVGAGPGASDDGMGVAAILEVARILKSEPPRRNSVIFLLDEGEEGGLLGAEAFASTHPWARDVGSVVNLEARGTSGASLMFETSDENSWLIAIAASALPHPVTSSVFYTIYKWLPNDTDLTVFRAHGIAGVNFACIGSEVDYHTPLDDPVHASRATLQHHGENALAMARALADTDLAQIHQGNAVFFDLFGRAVCRWPEKATVPLAAGAFLLIVAGLVLRVRRRELRLPEMGWGVAASLAMVLVPIALALIVARLLRMTGALPVQWIAHPAWLIATLWLLSISTVWFIADACAARVGRWGLWAGGWLAGSGGALALAILAPGLSFVILVPVAAASLLGLANARLAVSLPAIVTSFFWLPMAWTLYDGLGVRGSAVIAVMVAFPAAALAAGFLELHSATRRWIAGALAVAALISLTGAALAPPFSSSSPQRMPLVWHEDGDSQTTRWLLFPQSGELPTRVNKAAVFTASLSPFPWSSEKAFTAPASGPEVPAPEWRVTDDTDDSRHRVLRATIRSRRGAPVVFLAFPQSARPTSLRVNGQSLPELYPRAALRMGSWRIYSCLTVPPEGIPIELEFSSHASIDFFLGDESYDLPPGSGNIAAARLPDAVTSQEGDVSVVTRRIRRDGDGR